MTWNGTDFVVVWNDQRNGNQDIYAARVKADRTVLDPSGIAVTTAAGAQRAPSVASGGGPTLIAWSGSTIQRRIMRTNGTFTGAVVDEGTSRYPTIATTAAAADPGKMGLIYVDGTIDDGTYYAVLAAIDPTNGATLGHTRRAGYEDDVDFNTGVDLSFDGTRFVYVAGLTRDPGSTIGALNLGTVTGTTVASTGAGEEFETARIDSRSDGHSLLLGTVTRTAAVAPVDDAP